MEIQSPHYTRILEDLQQLIEVKHPGHIGQIMECIFLGDDDPFEAVMCVCKQKDTLENAKQIEKELWRRLSDAKYVAVVNDKEQPDASLRLFVSRMAEVLQAYFRRGAWGNGNRDGANSHKCPQRGN